MMTEIETIEGGQKDVSLLEGTTFIKSPAQNVAELQELSITFIIVHKCDNKQRLEKSFQIFIPN